MLWLPTAVLWLTCQDLPPQPSDIPLVPASVSIGLGKDRRLTLDYKTMGYSEELAERARRIQGPSRLLAERMLGYRWEARLATPVPVLLGRHQVPAGTHKLLLWYGEGGALELIVLSGRERSVLGSRCYRSPVNSRAIACSFGARGGKGLELIVHFGPTVAVLNVGIVEADGAEGK